MRKTTIKDYLKDEIPKNKLNLIKRSFEIVGEIAITEIDDNLIEYENKIGKAIMKVNLSVKSVFKKHGIHSGEFRTQKLIHIAGINNKETIYQENGIKLKINPEKVYFSARLSVERQELMKQLKENKKVLIMFSGIGPYTFVALKKQPNLNQITSIELNPEGHKYALKNLKLNKNLLKKSKFYKDLINFLRENKIPIYEKIIIKNLNDLRINFINGDVKKEIIKFKLNEKKDNKIEFIDFNNKNPKEIFNLFKKKENEKNNIINIDFDKLKKETKKNLSYLIVLFGDKFNFNIKINEKIFEIKNKIEKIYLLNILEGKEIENINKFDEIYMPLPKDAELFLEDAFKVSTKNTIIHMYDFVEEINFPNKTENAIKKIAKENNIKIKILQTRKVGQYAPGKYRVCSDFIIK